MVLQWAENRDLRHYLDTLVQKGLSGSEYVVKVNKWVRGYVSLGGTSDLPPPCQLYGIAQGLEYLHYNGVVHSDLRGVRRYCCIREQTLNLI